MDDYIKRKRRNLTETPAPVIKETESEIVIRETRNEISDLITKVRFIEGRTIELKKRLSEVEIKANSVESGQSQTVLGKTSEQKPSVKNEVPDGKTFETVNQFQETGKLEPAASVAAVINGDGVGQHVDDSVVEKLEEPGKRIIRKRKTRM